MLYERIDYSVVLLFRTMHDCIISDTGIAVHDIKCNEIKKAKCKVISQRVVDVEPPKMDVSFSGTGL